MRHLPRFALFALALGACGPELNPSRPPPARDDLGGGVWVAYNLGCPVGCDQIKRGDRILAVDGRPVESGAEVDAIGLARGAPVTLSVARYRTNELRDVTIVAEPNDRLPPLTDVPPLLTVGAAALDRAPEWARRRLYGHAIPAMRLLRSDEPRGWANGRELYGRGAVMVFWGPLVPSRDGDPDGSLAPAVYAHLQQYADQLAEAGVDAYFVLASGRAAERTRAFIRKRADASPNGYVAIWYLASDPNDPNTLGLENPAADIREALREGAPAVVVLDRRGIVRFHAAGLPAGAHDTMAIAIDFALKALPDVPAQPHL